MVVVVVAALVLFVGSEVWRGAGCVHGGPPGRAAAVGAGWVAAGWVLGLARRVVGGVVVAAGGGDGAGLAAGAALVAVGVSVSGSGFGVVQLIFGGWRRWPVLAAAGGLMVFGFVSVASG